MAKKIGVYPGSFDPFTNGHLYVLKQAVKLFDEVWVLLANNASKKRRFDADKMVETITKVLEEENLTERVKITKTDLAVSRWAQENQAEFLVRGLRDGTDYKYEENLAEINYHLSGLETIYFRAGSQSYISSAVVMELWELGEKVSDLVPAAVNEILK